MAEPYIPTIKDFDFFFKFLFAYFFLQVWALLTGQGVNYKENLEAEETEEDNTNTPPAGIAKKMVADLFKKAAEATEEAREREAERLAEQRKYLFQFIFLSMSMIIFAYVMIGFLDVPARDVGNIGVFVFITASLLKYLFDFTVTDSQVRMIILSGIALYVDSLRETAGRIAAQF
jgi:ABC-type multidrug transport system fused ATPase/permease subunit